MAKLPELSPVEKAILEERARLEAQEQRENFDVSPEKLEVISYRQPPPVETLYSIVYIENGEIQVESLTADKATETHLSHPTHSSLFNSWRKRCFPGDMTMIGKFLIFRSSD